MKIQRKKVFILGIFVLANTFFVNLNAQASFVVNRGNLQAFTQHLLCEYGDDIQVSGGEIKDFFYKLPNFQQAVDPDCAYPKAEIIGSGPGSMRFDWGDVLGADNGYHYASFSLDNGQTRQQITPASRAAFTGLSNHLYLFAFISHCGANRYSKTFIIIGEKDILLTSIENPSFNLFCYCDGRPTSLPYKNCIGTYSSYSFSYNNSCPANKYQVSVNGYIGDESYHSNVFFINNEVPSPDEILVLSYCTPHGNQGGHGQTFGDLNNYSVVFTANSLHVYINNEALQISSIEGYKCGCYYPDDDDGPYTNADTRNGDAAPYETVQMQAFPNPFSDQLRVEIINTTTTPALLKVYDISGKEVAKINRQELAPGEHQFLIPTSNLPAGIYHLKVKTANQTLQQKILKIN